MPAGDYLGADDFIELLDYASAAVNTLTAGNLTVSFRKGNVVSTQTENGAEQTTQYDVSGKIQYYSGGKYPFVINTADKAVTVNADLYLHVEFSYVDQNKNGEGIFLNLDLLDYDENGVLDFFVTLSRFAADDARYMPLKLYADANEIVNILACGCALLGVDFDLVNDYLISHYLDVKTTAQLRALGSSLLKSFGIGDLFAAFAGGAAVSQEQTETFIRDIVIGKELFTIEAGGVRIEVGKTRRNGRDAFVSDGRRRACGRYLRRSCDRRAFRGFCADRYARRKLFQARRRRAAPQTACNERDAARRRKRNGLCARRSLLYRRKNHTQYGVKSVRRNFRQGRGR